MSEDVQLEAIVSGLSVGIASWSNAAAALEKLISPGAEDGETSSEADWGQVPALEWNKSETQER